MGTARLSIYCKESIILQDSDVPGVDNGRIHCLRFKWEWGWDVTFKCGYMSFHGALWHIGLRKNGSQIINHTAQALEEIPNGFPMMIRIVAMIRGLFVSENGGLDWLHRSPGIGSFKKGGRSAKNSHWPTTIHLM